MKNYLNKNQLKNLKVGDTFYSKQFMWELTVTSNNGEILKYKAEETDHNYQSEEKMLALDFVKDNVYYTK